MSWDRDHAQQSNKAQVCGPIGKANEAHSKPRRRRFTAEFRLPVVDRPRKRKELHSSCRGTNRSRRRWSSTEKERKMTSLLQSFIDPKKNWMAALHMKALSRRLRKYGPLSPSLSPFCGFSHQYFSRCMLCFTIPLLIRWDYDLVKKRYQSVSSGWTDSCRSPCKSVFRGAFPTELSIQLDRSCWFRIK